jgi:hypothetical protein
VLVQNEFDIVRIEWLDEEIKEASVSFDVNGNIYTCFSYVCDFNEGGKQSMELSALVFDENKPPIVKTDKVVCHLTQKGEDLWSYQGVGKVISLSPLLVDFDGIVVDFDDEIETDKLILNCFVELNIGRLDGARADKS